MKNEKASRTAEYMATVRAIESLLPASMRVCFDEHAKDFTNGKYALLIKMAKFKPVWKIIFKLSNFVLPGVFGEIIYRTRFIDDYLKKCIDGGIEQLVLLGAGYDTRPYRISQLEGTVRVFEIDHPATQREKLIKLKKIFKTLSADITYVPVDFSKEFFDKNLLRKGYDKYLKTLFIWEGVTMYLTHQAVDKTLAFIANNSGKNSSIIFNYINESLLKQNSSLDEAKNLQKLLKMAGEPFSFWIKKDEIFTFLSRRGFKQINNIDNEYYERIYFKPDRLNWKTSNWISIVHASVA